MGAGLSTSVVKSGASGALMSASRQRSKGSDVTGNGRQLVHSHIPKQDGLPPIQSQAQGKNEREN